MLANPRSAIPVALFGLLSVAPASAATTFFFSTGNPDGLMATASRPESAGKFEIESADDFILAQHTDITSATFTGLLPSGAPLSDIKGVTVEIYRVFPADSDVGRTSGPPTFSTSQVPTRVNSPSDNALDSRDSASGGGLSFTPGVINPTFTANNSVQPGGIHPQPGQTTGGNGKVTGQEVSFNVIFTKPFDLPADHYFFVPQVQLANGDFLWLSAPKPITDGSGPFMPDLQSWTRDAALDPDWLRVGTDITGQGPFNATFSLFGAAIPEPMSMTLLGVGFAGMGLLRLKRKFG